MAKSNLERLMLIQMIGSGMPRPVEEYQFHPTRGWRFDFAYPEKKIAFELEGGTWSGNSRHTNAAGFQGDCVKYNTATAMGWRIFRFTAGRLGDVAEFYKTLLQEDKNAAIQAATRKADETKNAG